MLALILWAGVILGQQGLMLIEVNKKEIDNPRNMRDEIHRRILNKLLHGIGPDQDMFSDMDKMMDDMTQHSLTSIESSQYRKEWTQSTSGRTLILTPKSLEQQLDINVTNGIITISGKVENKNSNGVSYSSFNHSFNVPSDCNPAHLKTDHKQGKVLLYFPFTKSEVHPIKKSPQNNRRPLPPADSDVQI